MDQEQDHRLADLLRCAQKGEQDAYGRFLAEAARLLRAFLFKRMGGSDMVEDVLQDTLFAVHRARNTFLPGKPIGPWLYTICEHRMMDFYRKFRRLEKRETTLTDDLIRTTHASEDRCDNDQARQVHAALAKLPKKQRQVISLIKLEDVSVNEAAHRTGMTESAVKVTAFRGYEKIRRLLGVKRS